MFLASLMNVFACFCCDNFWQLGGSTSAKEAAQDKEGTTSLWLLWNTWKKFVFNRRGGQGVFLGGLPIQLHTHFNPQVFRRLTIKVPFLSIHSS